MNYREVDITKGTNHFIIGAEGYFFSRKKKYVEVSLKKYFNLLYVKKTYQSENTNNKNCVQKYTFNQKGSEESSRNVCSADLEDTIGEELCLFNSIGS
jgi:hypothetical protein